MNLSTRYLCRLYLLACFFLFIQQLRGAENSLHNLYQFRIARIDDLDSILKTMSSIPHNSSDRKKVLVYPSHKQKEFVQDAIEKERFFVAMNFDGACVGYKKFFKVETDSERLEIVSKNMGNIKNFVDSTKINFLNQTIQFYDRSKQLNPIRFNRDLSIFYMGSEYVVPELRNLRINATLSTASMDSVFLLNSHELSENSQIGFAYCLSSCLDYDQQGNGKSRTPLMLKLFLASVARYFAIGNVTLYRFVTWMPTFDNDGNLVHDPSCGVRGYGNLCIIDKKQ